MSRTSNRVGKKAAQRIKTQRQNPKHIIARARRSFSYVEGMPVRDKVQIVEPDPTVPFVTLEDALVATKDFVPEPITREEVDGKECALCHRVGKRGFMVRDGAVVCSAVTACEKRRA